MSLWESQMELQKMAKKQAPVHLPQVYHHVITTTSAYSAVMTPIQKIATDTISAQTNVGKDSARHAKNILMTREEVISAMDTETRVYGR